MRITRRNSRRCAVAPIAALLVGFFAASSAGQEKKISFDKVQQLCQQFDAISPPPPPVESVLIGTLDMASGQFTWGPTVYAKTNDNSKVIVDLGPVFDKNHIRAITPNLDPKITGLGGALGGVINSGNLGTNIAGHVNTGVTGVTGSAASSGGAVPHSGAAPAGGIKPKPQGGKTGNAAASGINPGDAAAVNVNQPIVGSGGIFRTCYAPVRSGQVDMVFKVINRPANAQVSVTADNRTSTADADQVDIVVPPRVVMGFKVTCGDKGFEDKIVFDRPPVLGCFTLEAFPVTVVYEPPGSSSSQKYTSSKSAGTTIETFTSKETSGTAPVDTPFSTVTEMISLLDTVGKVVEKVKPEVGQGMQTASQVLSAAWGSSETDEQITHNVTEKKTLSVSVTNSDWMSTSTHQGPGKGDVYRFLIKPTFLWLAAQDEKTNSIYITISLLGYEAIGTVSAEVLRQGASPMPSKEMQALMLQLDPMAPEYSASAGSGTLMTGYLGRIQKIAAGSSGDKVAAAVRRGRLVPADPPIVVFGESTSGQTFKRAIEESDTKSEETSDTVTTKETAGFLSYIAKNVPQDGEKKMSTVQGASSTISTSDTVEVEVTYGAGVGEVHALNVYYDRLFGTFAFAEANVSEQQQVTGQAIQNGGGAGRQPIYLVGPDGVKTLAQTDANGNFIFKTPMLMEKGQYKIVIANKEFPFPYNGQAIKGMKIDLGGGKEVASTSQPASTKPPTKAPMAGAGAYSLVPNPQLKGRLGQIVVKYPEAAPCKETHTSIMKPGSTKNAAAFYGTGDAELLPGAYNVKLGGKVVENVEVKSRSDSVITLGVLRVHAAKETHVAILDQDQKTQLAAGYGDNEYGLPIGNYFVKVAEQTEPVEIKANEVTDF